MILNPKAGFVMLTSVMVLSAALVLLAIIVSQINYYGRMNILQTELKENSFNLAESCVGFAILNLKDNINFEPSPGGTFVQATQNDKCLIAKIENSGSNKNIKTQGEYQKSFTNIIATVNPDDNFKIISYVECPTLTAPNFNESCN